MLPYPNIDPFVFKIGDSFGVRWYSLAYLAGIILGWLLIVKENARKPLANLSKQALDDIPVWAVAGIILGGRLGYVLFYKPEFYFANPLEIIKIWEGGMSSHGGFVGVAVAFYLFCRKYKINFLGFADLLACAAPIGFFFGRIANFINGELYGRVTDSPLGMVFPTGGDIPRHASQLYQAGAEGLLLFAVMFYLLRKTGLRERGGALSGVFLILYSVARIICEYFREPDSFLGFLYGGATMGQLLSLPLLALGVFLLMRSRRRES